MGQTTLVSNDLPDSLGPWQIPNHIDSLMPVLDPYVAVTEKQGKWRLIGKVYSTSSLMAFNSLQTVLYKNFMHVLSKTFPYQSISLIPIRKYFIVAPKFFTEKLQTEIYP